MKVTIKRCPYCISAIHAARVAAALRKDPSLSVELTRGRYGEFKIFVDDKQVLDAGPLAMLGVLPSRRQVCELVERNRKA